MNGGKIDWKWLPSPPETLIADVEGGPTYIYECVGTVPASEDSKGDLHRVWVPEVTTNVNTRVIEKLEEKHGEYAESVSEAEEMDGFTPKALEPKMATQV